MKRTGRKYWNVFRRNAALLLQMGEDDERPNGQAQAEESEEDPEAAALELWSTVCSAVPCCSRDTRFDVCHGLCYADCHLKG